MREKEERKSVEQRRQIEGKEREKREKTKRR